MARKTLLVLVLLAATTLAGCTTDETLRIAFTVPDDATNAEKDPAALAAYLGEKTGRHVEVYWVQNTQLALEGLASGHADVAFVDGAAGWLGWRQFGLDAVLANLDEGRTHYVAAAWVRADHPATSMADLRGGVSCHTGLLKSAGMFMPLGWLVRNGLVERVGADDITSIEPTVRSYFPEAIIPSEGPYAGYAGALRCLSEGAGQVAFVKDTTPADYCGTDAPGWCLPASGYRMLQEFGAVPSHPVMVGPHVDAAKRADLIAALSSMHEDEAGRALLAGTLETARLVPVATEDHLGDYAANLEHVPGMLAYVQDKLA